MEYTPFSTKPFEVPVATLTEVDRLLIKADTMLWEGRRHAGIIGQAHMQIIKAHPELGFPYIETRYRFLKSDTYLLAAPLKKLPGDMLVLDPRTGAPQPYWVWICVNGEEEAEKPRMTLAFSMPKKTYDDWDNAE